MTISYKRLWKILIDRDMTKTQLAELAGISMVSISKMGRGENLNTDTLLKVANALGVGINDIMESVSNKETNA